MFLYQDFVYDPSDVWKGLFRSSLLVCVRLETTPFWLKLNCTRTHKGFQAHFYFAELGRP